VDARRLELRVFAGPSPADVLRRMTDTVGRQPPAAAPFFFGSWWQPSDDEQAEVAAIRRGGVPVSVAQTYTHYLPCGDHQGRRRAERARAARMHRAGMAVTTYINPMVCVGFGAVFDPGAEAGAFTAKPDGTPYTYHYSTATEFDVAQFDFSSDAGRRLFHGVLDLVIADGYDGWMEDFGEYTPDDAVSADGTPGTVMHNRYVELYHAAANEFSRSAPRPLARFNRSGWTGAIAESQIVWGGDPTTNWGFDGLASAVRSGLGMGLSGVSLWGSDIGGFFTWPGDELTPELLRRWIQFGAFSGVMRLQSGGISITDAPRADVLDPAVLPVWRRYSQLRTRLYPYIAGAQETYDRTGLPMMRHLVLAYPDDDLAVGAHDQYLFGADLLVAPVVERGATRRRIVLPGGRWIDLWRTVGIDEAGRWTLGAAAIREGGSVQVVDAPPEEIPLLVRLGAVVPLAPRDVDTLADYGDDPGIVNLSDRPDRELIAFPGEDWNGPLGPGETLTSTVAENTWRLEIDAAQRRRYRVQASVAGIGDTFEPCQVTLDDDETAWSYDAATQVLDLTIVARSRSVLEVTSC